MKRILFLAFFLPLFSVAQKSYFKVVGDLKKVNASVDWVYLQFVVDGEWKTDSVQPKRGKYRFTGTIGEPVLGRLRIKQKAAEDGNIPAFNNKRDLASIFLEKGKTRVVSTDSFSNVQVSGSLAHDEYVKLNEALQPFQEKLNTLYASYSEFKKNKDEANLNKTIDDINAVNDDIKESVYGIYVKKNPGSPVAVYAVKQYAGWDIDADKVEPLFAMLPASLQNWPSAIELKEKIEIAKKTGIGKIAMEFVQNDTLGIPVALSSFRGKYLLIDFWASWCGPCRDENPNVVKAFHKYKDKGFFVLGVSLDRPGQKEKWLKAIYDDQLYWTHVSDLKFWQNEVAVQYGINAIPQNLLLDPHGKIIAKNLRGEELDKKLEEFIVEGKKAF